MALADKLDTLAGFWSIGKRPPGQKDPMPYAGRRSASSDSSSKTSSACPWRLSLPRRRQINELKLREQLEPIRALDQLVKDGGGGEHWLSRSVLAGKAGRFEVDEERVRFVVNALLSFIADRVKVVLREQGVRHDLVTAVFRLGGEDDWRLLARVEALNKFLDSEAGANLLVAYRRAANIVRIEEKKDGRRYQGAADPSSMVAAEEKNLHQALLTAERQAAAALEEEDFTGSMEVLARLREPVDNFFAQVTVNADDPALRANRLALLSQIGATLNRVADFSAIEG